MGTKIGLRPYGSDSVSNADAAKRRRNELWQNLNRYVREIGGAITSPAFVSPVRIEISKTSNLPVQLADAGYVVHQAGMVTRIQPVGSNPFANLDVIEVDLPKVN